MLLAGVFAPTLFSKAYGNLVCDSCTNSTGANSSGPFVCHNCHYDLVGIISQEDILSVCTVLHMYNVFIVVVVVVVFNRAMVHCFTTMSSKLFFKFIY